MPAISLLKFGICFTTTNIAETKAKISIEKLSLEMKKIKIGREIVAIVELTETNLTRSKTRQNIPTAHKVGTGARPKKTPQDVSTPFPPFALRKIDQLWPQIAKSPAKIATHSERPNQRAKNGGKNPFPKSKIRVGIAYRQPTALKTLVNPIFPEPTFLMSIPFNLASRSPIGTEPKRYAKRQITTPAITYPQPS